MLNLGIFMRSNLSHIPTRYYYIAMVSALLVGVNCFVVALKFMLSCQVHISLALACAAAGFALNTALYWYGGAQKLAAFYASLPGSLYSRNTLIAVCSGLCMGALTYDSYLGHYANMSDYWRLVLPFYPVAITFSVANMLSNFVLFLQDDSSDTNDAKTPSGNIYAGASSFVQSSAYTLLNYTCVFSLFTTLLPGYLYFNILVSSVLAVGLMLGEYRFNYDIIDSTKPSSPTTKLLGSTSVWERLSYVLTWSAIFLNGFANGWVALGYLEINSLLAKLAIVANGTFVSVAVMKSSVDNVYASMIEAVDSVHAPLFPAGKNQQKQLCSWLGYSGLALVTAYGCLWQNAAILSPWIPTLSYTSGLFMIVSIAYSYACKYYPTKDFSVAPVKSSSVKSHSLLSSVFRWLHRAEAPKNSIESPRPANQRPKI